MTPWTDVSTEFTWLLEASTVMVVSVAERVSEMSKSFKAPTVSTMSVWALRAKPVAETVRLYRPGLRFGAE